MSVQTLWCLIMNVFVGTNLYMCFSESRSLLQCRVATTRGVGGRRLIATWRAAMVACGVPCMDEAEAIVHVLLGVLDPWLEKPQ